MKTRRCLICNVEFPLDRNKRLCSPKCLEIRTTARVQLWHKMYRRKRHKPEFEVVTLVRLSRVDRAVRLLFAPNKRTETYGHQPSGPQG